MVPTEGSELEHRKKVTTDEISIMPIQTLTLDDNLTHEPKPLVLKEVQWNVKLMYSGNPVSRLYQLIHTSLPTLFQWRLPTL